MHFSLSEILLGTCLRSFPNMSPITSNGDRLHKKIVSKLSTFS